MSCQKPYEFDGLAILEEAYCAYLDERGFLVFDDSANTHVSPYDSGSPVCGNVEMTFTFNESHDLRRMATAAAKACYPQDVKGYRNRRRATRLKNAKLERLRWERYEKLQALAEKRQFNQLALTFAKIGQRITGAVVEMLDPVRTLFNTLSVIDYGYSDGEVDPGGYLDEMEYTDGEWVDLPD